MDNIIRSVSSEESLDTNGPNSKAVRATGLLSKHENIISADIDQFLPTEVSSVESDNGDDNDDLLDEINENEMDLVHENVAIDTLAEVAKSTSEHGKEEAAITAGAKATHQAAATVARGEFRDRPSSCVFAASLDASLSDDELCISVTESFKKYGELARVKVLRDHANRPYAFVQYTNDKDAKRALRIAQGSILNGRTLRCESARVNRTLFITHHSIIQFRDVIDTCEKFGELEKLVPNKDHHTQYSRKSIYPAESGLSWFVQFAFRDDAIRAFANLRSLPDWDVEWVQNIDVPKYFNLLWKHNKKNKPTAANIIQLENDGDHNHGMQKDEEPITNNEVDADDDEEEEDDDDDDDDDSDDDGVGYDEANDGAARDNDSFIGNESDYEENENYFTSSKPFKSSFDKRSVNIDKKSIFVGQLDSSVTKPKLFDRFSLHGKIVDINLIAKTTNVFAFIQFETESAAASALEKENHAILLNKTMHVQYRVIGGNYGKRFPKKAYYQNKYVGRSKSFSGPQVNLAPPPINMYRRRSTETDPILPFVPAPFHHPEYDVTAYMPYMNQSLRHQSLPNGARSSGRTYSFKSESDSICCDGNTDATSDVSQSAGLANSATTYNNSSAGSMNQNTNFNSPKNHTQKDNYNNNYTYGNNNNFSHNNNNYGKRKYFKRHNYKEASNSFYFQPYYYHPMHYPIGPMGPGSPGQAPNTSHPYMMMYPMPPHPPSSVEGPMLSPLPVVQQTGGIQEPSNISTKSQFKPSESNKFIPNSKQYHLNY